ncbi:MAG TPA: methyltransferase domain-containing protein [Phycisphaerae bacterium]|nr:methyltransferase domain-containing protein [Phycisphaerae bacterium]HUT61998.1 methyltransferase domain-containing protein [Phycisphaerae bacterium]
MDTSRLSRCGWNSFRTELFLGEPGRQSRNVGPQFLAIARDFCGGQSVLELCCGAGRLCIELARAGYDVTGIDLDERMLRTARRALGQESADTQARARFTQDDVTRFDLDRQFDLIMFEDDGFVYLLDQADQLACLDRVRRHLAPEGWFLLAFTTPQRELDQDYAGRVLGSAEFEYDPLRQVKTCLCSWTVADQAGGESVVQEGHERRRLTYPCELELLLRSSSLEVVERWGDLERTPFRDPCRQDYHYLCRKA